MPEVSRFYGIVIRIYYGDHPPPHFHAVYQAELRFAFQNTANLQPPGKIDPLP
jgi:hypothetical protein